MNSGRNIDHAAHPAHPLPGPGLTLVDIYFVVFRRKWVILICGLLGIAAAAGYYFMHQPKYESSAKLMIKYVSDSRPVNPVDNSAQVTTSDPNAALLNAEMDVLTSFDVYEQVATNVGPEKILAKVGGGSDGIVAAGVISSGVKIVPSHDSSVIQITFSHPDRNVVGPVLDALIQAYREKHIKVHKSIAIPDDFLMEKTSDLQQQIAQIDEELRQAKTNAGIIDVADAEKSYSDEIALLRQELFKAEADLAEHQASVSDMNAAAKISSTNGMGDDQKIPDDLMIRYKAACTRIDFLQKRLTEFSYQGFTESNKLVVEARGQISDATKLKSSLESQCPALAALDFSTVAASSSPTASNSGISPQVTSLPTRIKTLRAQLAQVQGEAVKMGDAEGKINDLLRKKKIKESYFENFKSQLEHKQIDEALGPGQLYSNIPIIEDPTPPFRDFKKFYKTIGALLVGGFLFGIGLAFLIEFYLDRTIKRPIEVQTKLKIPFFLSIPDLNQGNRKALGAPVRKQLGYANGKAAAGGAVAVKETPLEVMSWEVNRRFDSYYDALRDRLVVYFESINLTRKPKLVAVTSTHKGAGVSTIAAGLASSLSETGDGRVLLVDMNLENGAAQQFFQGKPSCKLDDALESETRDGALVSENLYVVTEDTFTDKLPRALPKRFASLIPKLKASDYDYIIFDMPPVSPTSVTARLSGFMDTVMLVIESEKTDQQVVQQANALLAQSKANVTAVLNKTKTYIPARLHQDFLSDI
ncbi:MAG TPA: Wzz/FepE/Etk N-terminal domain-containing protein [Verrucomicrobiae bacterium]|nr:Wzz/FepE/Etk N-terminal domain-containing protein [Verrucomicrobiae bacterium]